MIKKIDIINGLSYIEIPEANLFIQCGSPAESVKHLLKHKIIKTIQKNNITFETGPNAILLSDVMIQNGEFSNMSEFSVLQMLYRQGMILPNHPNNTGLKPMLMGLGSQVEGQMNYIYRGNYGLISKEEIMECNCNDDEATALMNMKLKFAFGKLQLPETLLDSCIVEEDEVEIRDGVFIKRKRHNVFLIRYKNNQVEVNLNLSENQTYLSPYSLPQNKIERDYFSVIHTGQGDGWDIHRTSMSSILSFKGKLYIIDAIPNLKYVLDSLSLNISDIEGVFQTHTHDDHLSGITSLLRSDKKIKFYASKLVVSAMAKKISALLNFEELEFYNLVDVHELEINHWNNIDGLEVKPYISPHPVETTIFVFRTLYNNNYKTYGHFADIIDKEVLRKMIVKDGGIGISQLFFDEVIKNYTQTLDLKKIDIGGGIIHGNVQDFIHDATSKIILAHTSHEISKAELKIGSQAQFGDKDILIQKSMNCDFESIDSYLKSNFPTICSKQREAFFDFELIEIKPKNILIDKNENIQNVYLIVSGQIESIKENEKSSTLLIPGIIIGQQTVLTKELPTAQYIAKSYVKLLKIPIGYFQNFLKKNNLIQDSINKIFQKQILQNTHLLNEAITDLTFNKIIEKLEEIKVAKGVFHPQSDILYIVISGEVNTKINDNIIETISKGEYFGGSAAILSYPIVYNFEVTKDAILYSIPEDILKDIPIIRWKLLEKIENQIEYLLKKLI